jgi:hypothetical protein
MADQGLLNAQENYAIDLRKAICGESGCKRNHKCYWAPMKNDAKMTARFSSNLLMRSDSKRKKSH